MNYTRILFKVEGWSGKWMKVFIQKTQVLIFRIKEQLFWREKLQNWFQHAEIDFCDGFRFYTCTSRRWRSFRWRLPVPRCRSGVKHSCAWRSWFRARETVTTSTLHSSDSHSQVSTFTSMIDFLLTFSFIPHGRSIIQAGSSLGDSILNYCETARRGNKKYVWISEVPFDKAPLEFVKRLGMYIKKNRWGD